MIKTIKDFNLIYLYNNITEPAKNHAIEEYFLKESNETIFSIWQNKPSILLGKHQNVYAEINIDYAKKNNIEIIRRLSGGGTVYCDLKNMQYSFITDNIKGQNSFEKFAQVVVEALKSLNLDAKFTGRNDIILDEKKISGNAQYKYKNRILHHGTILFDADFNALKNVLLTRPIKFKNKSVNSVSSRVGNISDYLQGMSVKNFMDFLIDFVIKYYNIKKTLTIDKNIIEKSKKYIKNFSNQDNIFNKKHHDVLEMSKKYDFALIEYKLLVRNNQIINFEILGDYFEEKDISRFLINFKGIKFNQKNIEEVLKKINISNFITKMNNKMLLNDLVEILK